MQKHTGSLKNAIQIQENTIGEGQNRSLGAVDRDHFTARNNLRTLLIRKEITKVTFITKILFITFVAHLKIRSKYSAMSANQPTLKVLRVQAEQHQTAKVNAAKRGLKIQSYIEALIEADEQGRIQWEN